MPSHPTLTVGSHATDLATVREVYRFSLALLERVDPALGARFAAKPISRLVLSDAPCSPSLHALTKALNRYVPVFCYWGHHQTDVTHYGVWIDLGALHKAEQAGQITQVSSDRWHGRSPYVLSLANGLILYRRKGRREVWRIA